ncbi:Integrase-type DNA-binding superfamily protein [Hibiscus syriacus]|uniref:Integrase-type DNA-binding superfamily protein n=1 Tax=Hibiscus syriacus TaxID=106335 RepID=A0A6A3AAX6_HIBSY|nr:Integrase-type DNA-binding superfamily protein [Hibiscus syriacus]
MSLHRQHHSSPFPSCFRPTAASEDNTLKPSISPSSPPQTAVKTNVTTSFYDTNLGIFSLTWSRTFLGCSVIFNLHPSPHFSPSSSISFHLLIKPFVFWKKHGKKKKLSSAPNIHVFWDFSRAKFGSGPEPESGFYISVVVGGEIILLVGDSTREAYARTGAQIQNPGKAQALVFRREHLFSNKSYATKAIIAGKRREISVECMVNDDAELCFSVDDERFEKKDEGSEILEQVVPPEGGGAFNEKNGVVLCRPNSPGGGGKKRRSLLMTARSSSSSSISKSSASSGGSSTVMDWESVEESELNAPTGFSLLVYAWKK